MTTCRDLDSPILKIKLAATICAAIGLSVFSQRSVAQTPAIPGIAPKNSCFSVFTGNIPVPSNLDSFSKSFTEFKLQYPRLKVPTESQMAVYDPAVAQAYRADTKALLNAHGIVFREVNFEGWPSFQILGNSHSHLNSAVRSLSKTGAVAVIFSPPFLVARNAKAAYLPDLKVLLIGKESILAGRIVESTDFNHEAGHRYFDALMEHGSPSVLSAIIDWHLGREDGIVEKLKGTPYADWMSSEELLTFSQDLVLNVQRARLEEPGTENYVKLVNDAERSLIYLEGLA